MCLKYIPFAFFTIFVFSCIKLTSEKLDAFSSIPDNLQHFLSCISLLK